MTTKALNEDTTNEFLPADCLARPPRVIICGVRPASFTSETVGTQYKDENYTSQHAAARRRSGTVLGACWEMKSCCQNTHKHTVINNNLCRELKPYIISHKEDKVFFFCQLGNRASF